MIVWKPYSGERIVSRFAIKDWHNIISSVSTDKELELFLQEGFAQGYVAYRPGDTPIAFVFLVEETWRDNQVQVHGGCFSGSAWDSYAALISLLEKLFDEKRRVRSHCIKGNEKVARFLQGIGFVNHYTSEHYRYFWLPYKRFINSPIYKRFKS